MKKNITYTDEKLKLGERVVDEYAKSQQPS